MIYFNVVLTVHLLLCLVLVLLVLFQQGKGADVGAVFAGGSNSVFGAAGAKSLAGKLTTGVAIGFMCTSILLVRAYQWSANAKFERAAAVAVANEQAALEAGNANTETQKIVEQTDSVPIPASASGAATTVKIESSEDKKVVQESSQPPQPAAAQADASK